MSRIALASAILLASCGGKTPSSDCASGEAVIDGACRLLCTSIGGCPSGQVCNGSGYCEPATGLPPRIIMVDGDSTVTDGQSTHGDYQVSAGFVIFGERLTGANVSLDGSAQALPVYASLFKRPGGTDARIEVDLPATVAPGDYILRVSNAFGADQATLPFLQGPRGADGTCNAQLCTSQTYPGATRVHTLKLRGVNGGSAEQSVALNGVERIGAPADGVWLGVIERGTHALSNDPDHNISYDVATITGLTALVLEIAAVGSDKIVVMVSRGDVSAAMNTIVATRTLAGELIGRGATATLAELQSGEAFAFVGYAGLGAGNGSQVVSSTGVAEATVVVVDGQVMGSRTAHPFGRAIESAEIVDGTIATADIGNGQITSAKIADGTIANVDVAGNAIELAKLAGSFCIFRNGGVCPAGFVDDAINLEIGTHAHDMCPGDEVAGDSTFVGAGYCSIRIRMCCK